MISEACTSLGGNIPSSVIRAVITRWTAHYLAYDRLITLRPALDSVITNDNARVRSQATSRIITGNTAAKQKAVRMVKLIGDSDFWESLIM